MSNSSKKSTGARKRRPAGKPAAASPKTDVAVTPNPPKESPAPEPSTPGHTAEEWLQVAKTRLNTKAWIVRAATAGLPPERKYTEDEIRRLIQRKLSEPA